MNSITHESRSGDLIKKVCWLIITLVLLFSLSAAGQDCNDTVDLQSQTIPAGEMISIVAGTINGQPGKQFVIEKDGRATLKAGKRIELNAGFKALSGSGLTAIIEQCDPIITPPADESVDVFPNPTDGVINVKSSYEVSGVRITDMSGFLQLEKTGINDVAFSLDISSLKAGFYILEIIVGKSVMISIRIEKTDSKL
jgi:hypothetical protein